MGFSLYHATALSASLELSGDLTGAAAFLVPSAVAATLVHTAPLFDATPADTLMVASMMTWGLSTSLMALGSISARTPNGLKDWVWVAGTSSAIDLGILAGVGLASLSRLGLAPDHLGWKVTYVTSVTAATALVLALPGTLIAPLTNDIVQIPDVILGSTAAGLALGLGTMFLIDFDIAPDLKLNTHVPFDLPEGMQVAPTVAPVASLDGKSAPPMVVGLAGRF